MSSWTSSPMGRSGGGVLARGACKAALDEPGYDETDDRGAGKSDAGAVADEVARVLDQLVGVFLGDRIGDILDRASGAARIVAIFIAETVIDSRRGVADHLGDVCQ